MKNNSVQYKHDNVYKLIIKMGIYKILIVYKVKNYFKKKLKLFKGQ